MQYNQCFSVRISIVIKETLAGTKNLTLCYYTEFGPIHLSNQGIIVFAIVDDR